MSKNIVRGSIGFLAFISGLAMLGSLSVAASKPVVSEPAVASVQVINLPAEVIVGEISKPAAKPAVKRVAKSNRSAPTGLSPMVRLHTLEQGGRPGGEFVIARDFR